MTTDRIEGFPQAGTTGEYSQGAVSTRVLTTIVAPAVWLEPTLHPTPTRSMSFHTAL